MSQYTSKAKANTAAMRLFRAGYLVSMSRERSYRTSGHVYFVEVHYLEEAK